MSGRPTSTARILTGVLGAAAVALGVFLALRPLTTLQVTVWAAAAALVGWAVVLGRGARGRAWPWALAAVLVVGAAALVVFTPYVIRACPAVLAALLALNAVRLLVRGLRPRRTRSTTSRAGVVTDRIVDVVVAETPTPQRNPARSASPRPPVSGTTIAQRRVLATAPHHRNGTPRRLVPWASTFQPAWAHAAPRTRRSGSGDIRPVGPAAGATDGVLRAFVLSDDAPHSGGCETPEP